MSGIFHDENGDRSASRVFLGVTLAAVLIVWVSTAFDYAEMPEGSIGLMAVIFTPLCAWAAGKGIVSRKNGGT